MIGNRMQQRPYVYLNDRIVPLGEAAVSPLDIGLLRGYAVFDLLRTVSGKPFLFAEHAARLRASAAELGLRVPASDDEIAGIVAELLELNGHDEATVRIVLTGGVSTDGMSFDPETPTFLVMTHELHEPPASAYENGTRLRLVEHERELPTAKTTGYLTMLRHLPAARGDGETDLLYHSGGIISEVASASFYIVRDGAIHAPAGGVLPGTVGTLALSVAEKRGIPVVRGEITLSEALSADEAFLTSTTRWIVPVVALSGSPVGDGRPGPVTRELMALLEREVAERSSD